MNKLSINDLLSSLQKSKPQEQVPTSRFVEKVISDKNKKINALSKKQEQMMKRQSNYEMAKEEMDKWVGIVKMNRQKQSLNFQQKEVTNLNVNFFPSEPINDFQRKLETKLTAMNVHNQKTILKHEDQILQKVDPEEAKKRLIQARKHRTAIFYEQQKRRRIAKIKSKLYHKIKKRQKMRQETKKVEQMNPTQKNQYIENLTKKRIKQRLTLRHNSKSKHIRNLLRFNKNEKNSIQSSINEINDIRHKQMEKVDEEMLDQLSQQYDDQNFREQAMRDLEKQLEAIQNQNYTINQNQNIIDAKLKDLKFIQNAKQRRLKKQKQTASRILSKLSKGKQLKQKDLNSDMQNQQDEQIQNNSEVSQEFQGQKPQRKTYGSQRQNENQVDLYKKRENKNHGIQSQIKNYLLGGNVSQHLVGEQKNKKLVQGINIEKLQNKYQPERVPIDLTLLIAQNKQIYENIGNEAALQNIRQFQREKLNEIQEQINKRQSDSKNKNLKGWGNWAGPGINQKRVDPQQELRKKLKLIEQIKKKRKDNTLAHVTINETRNKNLSQYFVRNLPHNFDNADQFDYLQSEPIGPEWNSLTQFKDNIKPKVITKAGQVIMPATLPKKVVQLGKKKK